MLDLLTYRRYLILLAGLFSILASLSAHGARLFPDQTAIAVGETTRITLTDLPLLALVRWEVSRELELVDSDRNGATVMGWSPGNGIVTMKQNQSEQSVTIAVRETSQADAVEVRAVPLPPIPHPSPEPASPEHGSLGPRPTDDTTAPTPAVEPDTPAARHQMAPAPIDPTPEEIARRKIAAFQSSFDPEAMRAANLGQDQAEALRKRHAFEISSDYTARRLLQTGEFSELGREYFKTWFDESGGLIGRIIARAKGRMTGYPREVLDLIQVIQDEKSKIAMKAPMDFDVGILTRTRAEAVEILGKLGGPAAVARFHEEFEHALRAAYLELFAELGGTARIGPVPAFIPATAAWHPEAYVDARALKQGGVAGKDLMGQTLDVARSKVREMRRHAGEGTLTLAEAMEEAARGTAKDLDKIERVFSHNEEITGVKPGWTAEQLEMIRVLRQVETMEMTAAAANAEIARISGGRLDLFDACDQLMDRMEAAWTPRKVKPQERLLAILAEHLDDADYDQAFKAAVAGNIDELSASAKKIVDGETARATKRLIEQVEAEYQARHLTGEALASFRELEALGQRLRLPLVRRVKEIFLSFSGFVTDTIKTPWVRESLPRREVMLIEKYLAGYLEIEESLKRIQAIFGQAGIHPPGHHLTGYLEIDAPRMKDLESAYANRAVGEPAREAQRLHREAGGDDTYVFRPAQPDPCDAELFKTLSGIGIRIVDAEDRLQLLRQWSGKRSAAEDSRDEKLRIAEKATEDMKQSAAIWIPGYSDLSGPWQSSVGALPGQLWDGLGDSFEEAYAWTNVKWEGSDGYGSEATGVAERIERLRDEYRTAVEAGADAMRGCVRKTLECELKLSDPAPNTGTGISASATVTPTAPPGNAIWQWRGSGGVAVASAAGDSANLTVNDKGGVTLAILDANGVALAQCASPVDARDDDRKDSPTPPAPKFSAAIPDNWDMQPIENGVKFVREQARSKGPCGWAGTADGSVTATFAGGPLDAKALPAMIDETRARLERQKSERKTGCASPDTAVDLVRTGGLDGVAGIELGEFTGTLVDYPNWVRLGNGGMSGHTGSSMIACGNGAAHGQAGGIEFSYLAGAGGCWDNSDQAYLVRQVLAAQKEARAIIASLRLDGADIRREPYTGPKYDGSDTPTVKLLPERMARLKVGDLATVEAVVENADPEDPPYTYDWSGRFQGKAEDLKRSATAILHPDKPGKYRVGVSVDGQRYGLGHASLDYEVADLKVKVERVPDDGHPVPVGGKAGFKAVLTIDGKVADGAYVYRWQPNTELAFSATESAAADTTTATFTRPGTRKVWVEVLARKGDDLATVASSEPLEVDVIQPRFSLAAEPKEPLVGQEIQVTLKDDPRLDDRSAGFRWEHRGDAINPGPALDERVFTLKPKNAKPVTVTARGYLRDGNVDLGGAEITLRPRAYEIRISEPRYLAGKPRIWVCDTGIGAARNCGMKEVEDSQFAVHHDLHVQALIAPRPANPRYEWQVSPGGVCGMPGTGAELKLNCGETGAYEIKLSVRDADGAELGEATASVNVSIGAGQLDQAGKSQQADEKTRQAKRLVGQGRLDEAIGLVTEAVDLDARHPEAGPLRNRWRSERRQIMQYVGEARQAIDRDQLDAARTSVAAASMLHPRFQPVIEAGRLLDERTQARDARAKQAGQLAASAQDQIRAGQYESALPHIGNLRAIDPARAGALARELAGAAKQAARAAEQARDFDRSGRLFGIAREADPADTEAARGVDNAPVHGQRMRQVRVWQSETGAALDQGDYDTAGKRLSEIRNAESTLPGPLDPRTSELDSRHRNEYAAYRKAMDELRNRAEQAMLARDCDQSRKLVGEVAGRRPADQERKWLDMMNAALAERAQRGECGPAVVGRPRGTYLGCYADTMKRDLHGHSFQQGNMTIERCIAACADKGFAFAATQYGSHCFCDDSYGKYGAAGNCNLTCVGAPGTKCGGNWANSVYATGIGSKTAAGSAEPACRPDSEPLVTGTYSGPGIRVRTGNYGRNCGACLGNDTEPLAAMCDGKARCEYTIDQSAIGDPAPGCGKDYVAVWECPDDDTWYAANAAPEAGLGKTVLLRCPGDPGTALPPGSAFAGGDRGAADKGHWRLVERRLDKLPGSACYPVEVTGAEGNLTVNVRSTCGENGLVSVQARWSPPPETIAPGEHIRIDAVLAGEVTGTSRGLDVPLSVDFDRVDLDCGYTSGGIKVIDGFAAGVGKPGGQRHGDAVMPDVGALGSTAAGRITLRLCSRNWHQYYIYEWQKGSPAAPEPAQPATDPGSARIESAIKRVDDLLDAVKSLKDLLGK